MKKEIRLEIGSGRAKLEGYRTLDNDPSVGANILADIEDFLPFEGQSIDEIRAHSILEHIDTRNKVKVMAEFFRVLKFGGILDIKVPIAGTPQSYQDPTHLSYWNENSFWYFIKDNKFHEAFKTRYSKYSVPCFKKVSDKTEGYCYFIKLQK